jgi:hypothetical protein
MEKAMPQSEQVPPHSSHRRARTYEEAQAAIDRAQAMMRELVPRDRSLVDEWLEEKRAEAARG